MQSTRLQLAKQIADCFALLQHVEAVALGGSHRRESGTADRDSDLDLYVYSRGDIPLETRCSIVEQTGGATQSSLNLNYWGRGDEWLNAPTGIEIDIVYFDASWMEEQTLGLLKGVRPAWATRLVSGAPSADRLFFLTRMAGWPSSGGGAKFRIRKPCAGTSWR